MVPAAWKLLRSRKILPGFLESNEQDGTHPLLISDESQARLGMVKDMRSGKCYLKDYDDYIQIYRAKGSGLKVVCISEFPIGSDGKIMSSDLMSRPNDRSVSPHKTLVAFPSTDPDAGRASGDIDITINQEQVAPPCVEKAKRASEESVEVIVKRERAATPDKTKSPPSLTTAPILSE